MTAPVGARPAAVLYAGTVVHSRRAGAPHRFRRTVWMPMVDLDRVDELRCLWPIWSARFAAVISWRHKDYGGRRSVANRDAHSLAAEIRDLAEERTGARPEGRVDLLAHARTWGWLFNPLAVYYCYDEDSGPPAVAVLEVTNTPWGERHHYVLDLRDRRTRSVRTAKALHVSPFLPMDLMYDIHTSEPGEHCSVVITVQHGETILFSAVMSLRRRAFSGRRLLGLLARHPFITHRVSAGIYTQALRLWRKKVAYIPHTVIGRVPQ